MYCLVNKGQTSVKSNNVKKLEIVGTYILQGAEPIFLKS
jgi:hypothetical protein